MAVSDKKYLKLLGENIKTRREKLGYTLASFADKADLNKGQLQKIEHGMNATSITILRRIAKTLEISLGELVNI